MKKIIKKISELFFSFIKASALTVIFCSSVLSCEIGLGAGVDLEAPVVKLTSHNDNDYVANSFWLAGTASDNEGITSLSIDFDDAGLHYHYEGSKWQKKTAGNSDWITISAENASASFSGNTMTWSVFVDTKEGVQSKDSNYNFSIIACDAMNNSGKNSKLECSLIVDTNLPSVLVYKPELNSTYKTASENFALYGLQDNNVISQLINGDFIISGRQENAISYKELRIEFDDGTADGLTVDTAITGTGNDVTTTASIAEANPFSSTRTKVYYTKTLLPNSEGNTDLRSWVLNVNQNDWITDDKNPELKTGKHLIRIISTSLSSSASYERKVLGFFVWWPEADKPWITMFNGSEDYNPVSAPLVIAEVYPSSNITGVAFDDDGIKSLTYTLFKYNDDNSTSLLRGPEEIRLPEENAKNAAISITTPVDNGRYFTKINLTDIYGNQAQEVIRYFKVMDVTPPKIEVSPKDSSIFVSSDANGNIAFTGKVTDDGHIKSLKMIYLDPRANKIPENIVHYQSGSEAFWNGSGNASDVVTYNGVAYTNKLYDIPLGEGVYDEKEKNRTYEFSKTFNLFTDFGISESIPLSAQYFVFRAVDNGDTTAVQQITLTGDSEAPVLTLDTVKVLKADGTIEKEDSFLINPTPTLPQTSGKTLYFEGIWSDNSTTKWNNINKIGDISFIINDIDYSSIVLKEKNKWSISLSPAPTKSGTVRVSIKDYGGNETIVEKSVFIEAAEAGIERISCVNADGAYGKNEEIKISLEFTKATKMSGYDSSNPPFLMLNNGKKAIYSEGDTTSKHIYVYKINESDTNTDTLADKKLLVTGITANGVKWKDNATDVDFKEQPSSTTLPTENSKCLKGRNIIIDTKKACVSSITATSSGGYYTKNSQINFKLEFDENVTIDDASKIRIKFKHKNGTSEVTSAGGSVSGSKYVLLTYTVADNDNDACPIEFDSITLSGPISVKDNAGNNLTEADTTNWIPAANKIIDFDKINVKTSKPVKPTITPAWGTEENIVVLTDGGTSFTIGNIETGNTVEYSVDGINWISYTNNATSSTSDAILLTNNENYTVKARQIDKAGNISEESDSYSVIVDNGKLLKSISSSKPDAKYKAGTEIIGTIYFRKEVKIQSGATVTLNVLRNNSALDPIAIEEAGESKSSFTFKYTVGENDEIDTTDNNNGYLNIKEWSFNSVTVNYGKDKSGNDINRSIPVSFDTDVINAQKNLADNRHIQIQTGYPKVSSATLSSDNKVLSITFDKSVTKIATAKDSSDEPLMITLEMTEAFKAPVVLTRNEYNALIAEGVDISSLYKAGVNGAIKEVGETKLKIDTTAKYILEYDYDDTSSVVTNKFKSEHKDKVRIPLYASNIKQGSTSDSIIVNLTGEYVIPVKGAKYKLTIPAGAVKDSVGNISKENFVTDSEENTNKPHLQANGIEKPVIRIKRDGQIISRTSSTEDATVTMPDTAEMKVTCQTPNASITWAKEEKNQNTTKDEDRIIEVKDAKTHDKDFLTTPDVDAPSSGFTNYVSTVTLGNSISNYTEATGLKIAITAKASKTINSTTYEEENYEYATRSVLKFDFATGGDSYDTGQGYGEVISCDGTGKHMYNFQIWLQGGDSSAGKNTIAGFPVSWDDCSTFKLMKHDKLNSDEGTVDAYSDGSWQGDHTYWYWVTWDLSSGLYPGFAAGDVPSSAVTDSTGKTKGPEHWYVGECSWAAVKDNTVLYPGETLVLSLDGVDNNDSNGNTKGTYFFRTKNYGHR